MVEKIIYTDNTSATKQSLNQMNNQADLAYQIANKKDLSCLELKMTCKDYINDLLLTEYNKKSISIHGLNTSDSNYSLKTDKDIVVLLYYNGSNKLPNNISKKIIEFVHSLEDKLKIQRSEFRITDDSKLECSFNKFWYEEPYLISGLNNMIRLCIELTNYKMPTNSLKLSDVYEKIKNAFYQHDYDEIINLFTVLSPTKTSDYSSRLAWLHDKFRGYRLINTTYETHNPPEMKLKYTLFTTLSLLLDNKIIKQKKLYKKEYDSEKRYSPSDIHNNYGVATFLNLLEGTSKEKLNTYICEITEQQDTTTKEQSEMKLKAVQE
jgi:hypothetical protein